MAAGTVWSPRSQPQPQAGCKGTLQRGLAGDSRPWRAWVTAGAGRAAEVPGSAPHPAVGSAFCSDTFHLKTRSGGQRERTSRRQKSADKQGLGRAGCAFSWKAGSQFLESWSCLPTGYERGTGVPGHGSRPGLQAGSERGCRRALSMRVPGPQPCALGLLLLLPAARGAASHLALLYHLTAVSAPAPGTPNFWASGWLGPQQYLSYSSLQGQAEPCGAWVWESQVSWYWEKETADLRNKQKLFLEALKALKGKGPYVLQGLLGCELGPDNASVPTAKFALNGEDFMTFDPRQGNWSGDWPEAGDISSRWQAQAEAVSREKTFLLYSCPQRLLGHLERGRGNLEWKEPPSMRLKARPGSPGFSVLTCSAFSFYPPELQLRFLRNGLAAGSGEGDLGPNGDGSFHAWSSLVVKRGDEHHYRCLVRHAGLAQPLTVELESPATSLVPVVAVVISLALLIAAAVGGALLWRRMRSGLPAPWIAFRGDDVGALLPTPGLHQDADSQDINAFPATV